MLKRKYDFVYCTEIQEKNKENTVMWTIPDMSEFLNCEHYQEIRTNGSLDYPDDTDEDCKIKLKIQSQGLDNSLIGIYYLAPLAIYVKCVLFYPANLRLLYEKETIEKDYQWVPAKQWQLLVEEEKKTILTYCKDGRNVFGMNFQFTINRSFHDDEHCLYNNRHRAELTSDVENLLNNSLFSDVTIKSVDGIEFCAHKAVLAIRCPVLQAHFQHNSLESVSNKVETQFESEVLKEVIHFIYTANTTPKLDEIPERLIEAADYYQLNGLKSLCEESLRANLTVENVIETLKLADLYTAANLKTEALMFIENRAKAVIQTEGWKTLQSASLIKSITEYLVISY